MTLWERNSNSHFMEEERGTLIVGDLPKFSQIIEGRVDANTDLFGSKAQFLTTAYLLSTPHPSSRT